MATSSHGSKKRKSHSKEESFPTLKFTNVKKISKSEGVSIYKANLGQLDVCIKKIRRSNINERSLKHEEGSYEGTTKIKGEFIYCAIDKVEDATNRIYFISERYVPAKEYLCSRNLTENGIMTSEFAQLLVDWLRGFKHILKSGVSHGNIELSSLLVTCEGRGKVGNLAVEDCKDDYRAIATTIRALFKQNCERLPGDLDCVLKYIEMSGSLSSLNEIDEHPMFLEPNGQLLYVANAYWKCDKQRGINQIFNMELSRVLQIFPNEDDWTKKAIEKLPETFKYDPKRPRAQSFQSERGPENDPTTQNLVEDSIQCERGSKNDPTTQNSQYSKDVMSFFKFYRNAIQHNKKVRRPTILKEILHEIWPYFADGLHFALIESRVPIGTKRVK